MRAINAGGIVDPEPAVYSWQTGDLTPPVVTITSGPAGSTEQTSATFTFTVDDQQATLLCSLDGAVPVACTSPKTTTTSGTGWRQWSVGSLVQAMYDLSAPHGFLVRDSVENSGSYEQQFHSREKGETPPELIITFGSGS